MSLARRKRSRPRRILSAVLWITSAVAFIASVVIGLSWITAAVRGFEISAGRAETQFVTSLTTRYRAQFSPTRITIGWSGQRFGPESLWRGPVVSEWRNLDARFIHVARRRGNPLAGGRSFLGHGYRYTETPATRGHLTVNGVVAFPYWGPLLILLAIAAPGVVRSRRFFRSLKRDPRLCRKCGYDLGGIRSRAEACPECGQPIPKAQD